MRESNGHKTFFVFLVLSILIHAFLLSSWAGLDKQALPLDNSPMSFSVLLETQRHTQKKVENPVPVTPVSTTMHQESPPTHDRSKQTQPSKEISMAEIHSRIHTRLAEYFVYPRLAQRRGIEGRVILAFQLLHTGEIHNIRVQKSSGHSLLDDAAMSAMARINRMEALAPSLHGHDIEVEIPVTYRLKQG